VADNIHKVVIEDRDGNPHNYMIVLHSAADGEALMWQIAAMAGESLGGVLQAALGGGLDSAIDFGAAGRDIAQALKGNNMPKFRADVLKHTTRDGHALADPVQFNKAYQANYGEILKAMREVLRVNRLFPQLDTPES
jgi:hypothetical protein